MARTEKLVLEINTFEGKKPFAIKGEAEVFEDYVLIRTVDTNGKVVEIKAPLADMM